MKIRKSTRKGATAIEYTTLIGLGTLAVVSTLDSLIDSIEGLSNAISALFDKTTTQLAEVDLTD